MDVLFIPLTRGYWTCIDAADWPLVSQHKWCAHGRGSRGVYAITQLRRPGGGQRTTGMHRIILGNPSGLHVDHINGLTRDNRRCNLRPCTPAENIKNQISKRGRSRFKGVSPQCGRWYAEIMANGTRVRLGGYATEEEAARAYNAAAIRLHGAFARLNEIPTEATP